MKPTGIKLICERADGEMTTWHTVFNRPVEDHINDVKHQKDWMGGKFTEIYPEFDNNGKYYKAYLDINNSGYNLLLGS